MASLSHISGRAHDVICSLHWVGLHTQPPVYFNMTQYCSTASSKPGFRHNILVLWLLLVSAIHPYTDLNLQASRVFLAHTGVRIRWRLASDPTALVRGVLGHNEPSMLHKFGAGIFFTVVVDRIGWVSMKENT